MGKEGLKALTQSLKINTTLTELVLDSLQTTNIETIIDITSCFSMNTEDLKHKRNGKRILV